MRRASSLLLTRSLFQHNNRIRDYPLPESYGFIRGHSSPAPQEPITHYTQNVQVAATLKVCLLTDMGNVCPWSQDRANETEKLILDTLPFRQFGFPDYNKRSVCKLNLAKTDAKVDVCTWENHEEIQLKALWKDNNNMAAAEVTNIDNCVSFKVEDSSYLQKLSAFMPGRWCNLVLESGNGDVKIENMKEANIDVITACGNVSLGEIRGNEAFICVNGGNITAEVISAVLGLKSSGGHVSLKKVIGKTVEIDTDGGNVMLGSTYGSDIKIVSSGGSITIKHIQAQNMAYVSSGSADIKIDGVDGFAFISSDGGNIEVQLLANAKEVKISAGTGNVTIFHSLEDNVQVERCHNLELHNEQNNSEAKESLRCRVLVSGSGELKVETRSWLEAVMMQSRRIS